jgi:ankyrin repeat protein
MSQRSLEKGLHQATAEEDFSTARFLLDRGANPNVEGFEYNSALQAAARRESVELVQLLLD